MRKVSLVSLECIKKESWGTSNDSILISIVTDAGTPSERNISHKKDVAAGESWSLIS